MDSTVILTLALHGRADCSPIFIQALLPHVLSRLLERYPTNAKIMKCYGRFQEHVCNDPPKAVQYYRAAAKLASAGDLVNCGCCNHSMES